MSGGTATGCARACYASIVEPHQDVEIYQRSSDDCPACLRIMATKHAAVAEFLRPRLAQWFARGEDAPS